MKNNFDSFDARRQVCLCAQCGYRFVRGDEVLRVISTDDMVHRDCFYDYIEDNFSLLAETIEL